MHWPLLAPVPLLPEMGSASGSSTLTAWLDWLALPPTPPRSHTHCASCVFCNFHDFLMTKMESTFCLCTSCKECVWYSVRRCHSFFLSHHVFFFFGHFSLHFFQDWHTCMECLVIAVNFEIIPFMHSDQQSVYDSSNAIAFLLFSEQKAPWNTKGIGLARLTSNCGHIWTLPCAMCEAKPRSFIHQLCCVDMHANGITDEPRRGASRVQFTGVHRLARTSKPPLHLTVATLVWNWVCVALRLGDAH